MNQSVSKQANRGQRVSSSLRADQAHLAVWMPSWVGDACMATPTLRALRRSFPDAKITGIMTPLVSELLADEANEFSWFDDRVLFHKKARRRQAKDGNEVLSRWQLASALRKRKIDRVLLLSNAWWTAAASRLAGIKSIVGYDRDFRSLLLHDRLPVPKESGASKHSKSYKPISAVDYYLAIAEWVGCEDTSKAMTLPATHDDRARARHLWEQVGFDHSTPTIVINSNSAKDSARIWPAEHVRELAQRLAAERGFQVLLHCAPNERESANQIAADVNHPKVASMGCVEDLPLGMSRGVMELASVVVSTDSGARHMAVAMNRPVVTLFGPTIEAWTTTYNVPEVRLGVDLECRGCYASNCPLQHQHCMKRLAVAQVFNAVELQMGRSNTGSVISTMGAGSSSDGDSKASEKSKVNAA